MSNYGSNIDLKQEHDVKIDFDTIETTEEEQTEKETEADLQRQLAKMASKSKAGVLQTGGNQRVTPRDRYHGVRKVRYVATSKRKTTQMEDCKQSSSSSKEQPTLQLFKEKPKVPLFNEKKKKKKTVSLFITDDDEETNAMEDDYEIVQKPSETKPTETFSLMTSDSRMDV